MKVDSIIRTSVSYINYITELKNQGYRLVGHGAFAQVYGKHTSNHVIKIGLVDDWKEDAYIGFLREIDPSNKLFPKIHSIERFYYKGEEKSGLEEGNIKVTDRYYVVKMERLLSFSEVKGKDRMAVYNRHGIGDIYDLGQCCSNRPKFRTKRARTAFDILKKLYDRYEEDIHDGNVMFRKSRSGKLELVITDPVSNCGTYYS